MNTSRLLTILFALLIFTSCEENIVTECEVNNINSIELTTFSSIQEDVFDVNCAFPGCHAGTSPQAGLLLTSGNSYSNLINVTSVLNPNFKIVQPGNSSESFLIKMLKNTGDGTSLMPPSGKINERLIDSIAAWIDGGAINN